MDDPYRETSYLSKASCETCCKTVYLGGYTNGELLRWNLLKGSDKMRRNRVLIKVGVEETDDQLESNKRKCQHWIVEEDEPKHMILIISYLYNNRHSTLLGLC